MKAAGSAAFRHARSLLLSSCSFNFRENTQKEAVTLILRVLQRCQAPQERLASLRKRGPKRDSIAVALLSPLASPFAHSSCAPSSSLSLYTPHCAPLRSALRSAARQLRGSARGSQVASPPGDARMPRPLRMRRSAPPPPPPQPPPASTSAVPWNETQAAALRLSGVKDAHGLRLNSLSSADAASLASLRGGLPVTL